MVDIVLSEVDNIIVKKRGRSLSEKLRILGAAARYDVSCSSSGVQRSGGRDTSGSTIGNSLACGICHSFTSDGRCVSLLKILLSNDCVYDCKYCVNRRSNDIERETFNTDEVVALTMSFYKRNYIEGLFLSSAVHKSPDETMLDICSVLYRLRFEEGFFGYIHCKAIPGADCRLIELAGRLADRMSVNIEMPSERSLVSVAPQKNKETVLSPMKYIKDRIIEDISSKKFLGSRKGGATIGINALKIEKTSVFNSFDLMPSSFDKLYGGKKRRFTPAGQSTQMIIGATGDTDADILSLTEALYKKMILKRVYYSAYVALNKDPLLPAVNTPPPLLREHRLYQADWLIRYYGFSAKEILEGSDGNLNQDFDPKCDWALRNLDLFPVEINKADRDMLLRVPGIGVKSAYRILTARRSRKLDFADLKKLGVVMKRAQFFITCNGRSFGKIFMEPDFIKENLSLDERAPSATSYTKLSMFDMVI
jgi:putative DNA modification/repair radical SAM protein